MILIGDCREQMRTMPGCSIDSIVTDPPYELDFMGKRWDSSGVAFDEKVWAEALRVLKPGGHLLAFGGTRTWHRMAVAIEDAGFEIRDSIHWTYGSGFPKSLDVSKAIDKAAGVQPDRVTENGDAGWNATPRQLHYDRAHTDAARQWAGWGTALKPSHEPIVMARKPLSGTVAATVLEHGTGAINVDGCRIGTAEDTRRNAAGGDNGLLGSSTFQIRERRAEDQPERAGRWPANTVLSHCADCTADGCGPSCPVADLDRQSGDRPGGNFPEGGKRSGASDTAYGAFSGNGQPARAMGDSGGASRFFHVTAAPIVYVPKSSRSERNAGVNANGHPTVKPVDLMRWLVRLVTPPGGTVLDPFLGSGTTAVAAVLEGMDWIGCELTADYIPIIEGRVARAEARGHQASLFEEDDV